MTQHKSALRDVTGAVADLGVMVPLAVGLIVVCGLDPSGVFLAAGALVIASGLYFQIPFPVQPLKALAAVAIANELRPGVIHAAGLEIAAFLLLMSIGGVADRVARLFTKPVVRGLQFGVGVLLVVTAVRLVLRPPDVFRGTPPEPWPVVFAVGALVAVWWAARTERYALALSIVLGGVIVAAIAAPPDLRGPSLTLPAIGFPAAQDFVAAFVLLVIPQLPLTFGNAVVAVTDVAHAYFGPRARRVNATRVCMSCGVGNVASALIGGAPMCHGAGGLTAHVRLGARSRWMNVGLGAAFCALGLLFARQVPAVLGAMPVWALAALLAYAGLRHAWLVADLRGVSLAAAVAAGGLGALTGNLTVSVAIGLAYEGLRSWPRTLGMVSRGLPGGTKLRHRVGAGSWRGNPEN